MPDQTGWVRDEILFVAGIADFTANSIVNTAFAAYDSRTGIEPLSGASMIGPQGRFVSHTTTASSR